MTQSISPCSCNNTFIHSNLAIWPIHSRVASVFRILPYPVMYDSNASQMYAAVPLHLSSSSLPWCRPLSVTMKCSECVLPSLADNLNELVAQFICSIIFSNVDAIRTWYGRLLYLNLLLTGATSRHLLEERGLIVLARSRTARWQPEFTTLASSVSMVGSASTSSLPTSEINKAVMVAAGRIAATQIAACSRSCHCHEEPTPEPLWDGYRQS